MNIEKYKIGFIGFGHLAEIIFNRLIQTKLIEKRQCTFIRKCKKKQHNTAKRLGILPSTLKKMILKSEVIIFCVPPQNIQEVLEDIKPLDVQNTFFISVLASTPIEAFEKSFENKIQIMRALPNISSSIGEGITTVCFNENITTDYKVLGVLIFTALGQVVEIEEKYMNVACAIGASGPAFVLKLMDAAIHLACEKGLNYQTSLKIVSQMFSGTSKLVLKKGEIEPLIQAIASPKGTTASGLSMYDKIDLSSQFQKVFIQAIERAEELS